MQYKFEVSGDVLKLRERGGVTGNVNTYECVFEFDEAWEGFDVFAVFVSDAPVTVEITNGRCIIPREFLDKTGYSAVGCFGTTASDPVRRISTNFVYLNIRGGAYDAGYLPATPDLWEKCYAKANTVEAELNGHMTDPGAHAELFAVKVDKEAGKGLSSNDYSDSEKAKLAAAVKERIVLDYTHTLNKYIQPYTLELETGIFTTNEPHGLEDGENVTLLINRDTKLTSNASLKIIPFELWAKAYTDSKAQVVSPTSFKISGYTYTSAENTAVDCTKFHFENNPNFTLKNLGLTGKNFRIQVRSRGLDYAVLNLIVNNADYQLYSGNITANQMISLACGKYGQSHMRMLHNDYNFKVKKVPGGYAVTRENDTDLIQSAYTSHLYQHISEPLYLQCTNEIEWKNVYIGTFLNACCLENGSTIKIYEEV